MKKLLHVLTLVLKFNEEYKDTILYFLLKEYIDYVTELDIGISQQKEILKYLDIEYVDG